MDPTLFILMRDDMDSMNPGKAMAQASHATSVFHDDMDVISDRVFHGLASEEERRLSFLYSEWCKDGPFGKVVVLSCDGEQLQELIVRRNDNTVMSGVVVDPSYPIKDGKITHSVSIHTCGYFFCENLDKYGRFQHLRLHP